MKIYELKEWEDHTEYTISLDYYIYKKWGINPIMIDMYLGDSSKIVYCLKYVNGYRLIAIGYENDEWYVLYNDEIRPVQNIKLLSDKDIVINKLNHYGSYDGADEYFLNCKWDDECVDFFELINELEIETYNEVINRIYNDKE